MFDFYGVLASFLLIHLLCDFYLQPDSWIAAKKASTYRAWQLYAHALLHGIGLIIPAVIIGLSWSSVACMVIIVSTSHFVIDSLFLPWIRCCISRCWWQLHSI